MLLVKRSFPPPRSSGCGPKIMGASTWVDPYRAGVSLLEIAMDWVSRQDSERPAFALELSMLTHRADWRLSIYRTPQGVQGVSVVFPGGDWRMEADDEDSALMLANMAVIDQQIPCRLTASERTTAMLRPQLSRTGRIRSESELISLTCEKSPGLRGGAMGDQRRPGCAEEVPGLSSFSCGKLGDFDRFSRTCHPHPRGQGRGSGSSCRKGSGSNRHCRPGF